MDTLSEEQVKSFWARVDIRAPNECWVWTKSKVGKKPNQYGVVWFNGVKRKTHRLSIELTSGKQIPSGMLACHKCDNPPCCNPAHLFVGTPKDNAQDCLSKGRAKKELGSQRYNAKLTEEAVAEIKAQAPFRTYGWGRAIAKKYGVGPTAINNVIRGRRWRQIGESAPIEAVTNPHIHDGLTYVPLAERPPQ